MNDTDDLKFRDHLWLILFCVFAMASLLTALIRAGVDVQDNTRSRYHDASLDTETQPVTTTQEYYEREKATGDK
jgi:hypothetical protein